jgi:hypothetical protein
MRFRLHLYFVDGSNQGGSADLEAEFAAVAQAAATLPASALNSRRELEV